MKYLQIYEGDGLLVKVDASAEHTVDAAVTNYLDTGRDTLLYLQTWGGDTYVTRASNIFGWHVSTSEGRERELAHEIALDEENTEQRRALGIWDDE